METFSNNSNSNNNSQSLNGLTTKTVDFIKECSAMLLHFISSVSEDLEPNEVNVLLQAGNFAMKSNFPESVEGCNLVDQITHSILQMKNMLE